MSAHTKVAYAHTNFHISGKTSIPSDNKKHKVTIAHLDFDVTLSYYIIARDSPHAHMKASFVNHTSMPLERGEVNAFVDNTFVANSCLEKKVQSGANFHMFVGVDASVCVDYAPVKKTRDQGRSGLLWSTTSSELHQYDTVIKNTKATPIDILANDILPLATTSEIKVKLIRPAISSASFIKPTSSSSSLSSLSSSSSSSSLGSTPSNSAVNDILPGNDDIEVDGFFLRLTKNHHLEWRRRLQPHEEVIIPFEYIIEWPANKYLDKSLDW
eukprot:TRINITY_DN4565_c0_g1_i1.p1 TRINITY_DN4565_c0_g1~~TRINITY_DN4565_c0_g1_i1.p1  ORF type:complete len:277 (-),score=41.13 TRINITY_DN4565_c0_g1_i1:54-863(-)